MSFMPATITSAVSYTVHLLNKPLIKEGIKKGASCVTLAFGLVEIYDIYQILQGREITAESYAGYPKWIQVANKVVIISAKVSLILSAGTSRPGVFIISSLVGTVFSSQRLERVFGPNTTFSINPWHPRHIVSIVAVLLALPSIAQSIHKAICWTFNAAQKYSSSDNQVTTVWLTDTKIRLMNLFNTITSRPVLHLGNQLGRFALR